MSASRIIKPINVFEQGHLGLPACCPCIAPDQLRLKCFEEGFDNGVIRTKDAVCLQTMRGIAVTPSTHRHLKAMFFEQLLVCAPGYSREHP